MESRRVMLIAYYFPPVGGAGTQSSLKFSKYLPANGYEPIIITGPGTAGGHWAPSDASLLKEVTSDDVVLRVAGPEPPRRAKGVRGRIERLLGRDSWSSWWVEGVVQTARGAPKVDVVVASMSPYQSAGAARRIATERRVPWVALLRDPWALDEMWTFQSRMPRRVSLVRMRAALASADAVVMNTQEAANRLQVSMRHLRGKVHVITNGYDRDDFAEPVPPPPSDRFTIVHTGSLHTDAGLRHSQRRLRRRVHPSNLVRRPENGVDLLTRSHVYLMKAVDSVLEANDALRGRVEVVLAGKVTAADRAATAGRPFVRFLDFLPHEQAIRLMRSANLLFLPMQNLPKARKSTIVPGKTYEYLASGTPVLAAVPAGDVRDVLTMAGTAHICDPDDVPAMSRVIAAEIEAARRGDQAAPVSSEYLARYERRALAIQLVRVLNEAISSSAR